MHSCCRGGTSPLALWSSVLHIMWEDARPDTPSRRTTILPYPCTPPPLDPSCGRRCTWPVLLLAHQGWGRLSGCRVGSIGSTWGYWERKGDPGHWGLRSLSLHPYDHSRWENREYYLGVVVAMRMVMGRDHQCERWIRAMRMVWRE